MLSHDGDTFGDFADDIDTLLVFVRCLITQLCVHKLT